MRATAALIRWGSQPGGWHMVDPDTADLGIEATIGLGHVPAVGEAIRVATAELERFADGQTERTVGIDPDGSGDVPLVDFGLGDLGTVDGDDFRVVVLTVAEDKDRPGRLSYIPQIGDVVDPQNLRMARASKKMTNGTGGGAFRSATPLSMPGRPATVLRPGGGCDCARAWVDTDDGIDLELVAATSDSGSVDWGFLNEQEGGFSLSAGDLVGPDLLYWVSAYARFTDGGGGTDAVLCVLAAVAHQDTAYTPDPFEAYLNLSGWGTLDDINSMTVGLTAPSSSFRAMQASAGAYIWAMCDCTPTPAG